MNALRRALTDLPSLGVLAILLTLGCGFGHAVVAAWAAVLGVMG